MRSQQYLEAAKAGQFEQSTSNSSPSGMPPDSPRFLSNGMDSPRFMQPFKDGYGMSESEASREVQMIKAYMQAELDRQCAQIRRSFELQAKEVQSTIEAQLAKKIERELMPLNAEIMLIKQQLRKAKNEDSQAQTLQIFNSNFATFQTQVTQLENRLNRMTGIKSPRSPRQAKALTNSPQVPVGTRSNDAAAALSSSLSGIGGDLGPAVRSIESEAVNRAIPDPQEFIFVADARQGESLGLHIIARNDDDSVEVAGVLAEGLAMMWNACNPKAVVRVGDTILAVNGLKGNSDLILRQLRTRGELRIHMRSKAAFEPRESSNISQIQ